MDPAHHSNPLHKWVSIQRALKLGTTISAPFSKRKKNVAESWVIGVVVSPWPTGPGPGFRVYKGLFRPFWDSRRLRENPENSLILQKNQALSWYQAASSVGGPILPTKSDKRIVRSRLQSVRNRNRRGKRILTRISIFLVNY
jgi:hypothetical protein